MPARTEHYRFVRWEIEDVDGVPRTLPGGYADVTRGGGMRHERVVFLGPSGQTRIEVHLKRGARPQARAGRLRLADSRRRRRVTGRGGSRRRGVPAAPEPKRRQGKATPASDGGQPGRAPRPEADGR